MTKDKLLIAIATVAAVVGLGVGTAVGTQINGTKTVVKTHKVSVYTKINNGDATAKMAKGFGEAAGQVPTTAAKVNIAGCYYWDGKMNAQNQPDWTTFVCVNATQ